MNSSKQCQRERRLKSQNIKLNKMRREGNIIQEIVEYNNIAAAFDHVVRGERQEYEEGKELLAKREEVIAQLQHEIATGIFTVEE